MPGGASSGTPATTEVLRPGQLVDPPYEFPDRTPPVVQKAVLAGLEPDPADRPLPHEFAEALEPVLACQPKARFSGFTAR